MLGKADFSDSNPNEQTNRKTEKYPWAFQMINCVDVMYSATLNGQNRRGCVGVSVSMASEKFKEV